MPTRRSPLSPRWPPAALLALLFAGGCGGGGSSGALIAAPQVVMALRGPGVVDSDHLSFGGRIERGGPVVDVTSGLVHASSADGFESFQIELPLALGSQSFAITALDARGRATTVGLPEIRRETPLLHSLFGVAVNGSTALGAATTCIGPDEVMTVARSDGHRTVISGPTRGAGPAFGNLNELAVDDDGTRLFVMSLNPTRTFVVDAATGDRVSFQRPGNFVDGVVHDKARDRIAYTKSFFAKELRVQSLATGADSVLTDGNDGRSPPFDLPGAIGFDPGKGLFVVVDQVAAAPTLLNVDPISGVRKLLTDLLDAKEGPAVPHPGGLAIDPARRRTLLYSELAGDIVEVDLDTGDRKLAFDYAEEPGLPSLTFAGQIAYDATKDEVLAPAFDRLMVFDLSTGKRSVRGGIAVGSGPELLASDLFVHDLPRGRLLQSGDDGDFYAVDLATGDRSIALATIDAGLLTMNHGERDDRSGKLIGLDTGFGSVIELDVAAAQQRVISDFFTGSGPDLVAPLSLAIDPRGRRVFLLDSFGQRVVEVDARNGARKVVAEAGDGRTPAVAQLQAIEWDAETERVVLIDLLVDGVILLDPANGERTAFADQPGGGMPDVPTPSATAIDVERRVLWVVEATFPLATVVAVDLDDGSRSLVASDVVGVCFPLRDPRAAAVDPESGNLWLTSAEQHAIVQLDPATGHRVAISR